MPVQSSGTDAGSASSHPRPTLTHHLILMLLALFLGAALLPGSVQAQNLEWVRSAGGVSSDFGEGIGVDAAGNVYVTGGFAESAAFGADTLVSAGSSDIFLARYDDLGNVVWLEALGGAGFERTEALVVDAAGNCTLHGRFTGTLPVGVDTLTGFGCFVARFDASGNPLWARSIPGGNIEGISLDASGNAYVTGGFGPTATFGPITLTAAGGIDVFVAKYSPAGDVVWAKGVGGVLHETVQNIAADPAGNTYITGFWRDTATFGPFTLTGSHQDDLFVVKFDAGGNVAWARAARGPNNEISHGIAADAAGSCYVTGSYKSQITFGTITLPIADGSDFFLAKYDTDGNVVWARAAGGIFLQEGRAIALDAAGNPYVTGWFAGSVTFGSFTLTIPFQVDIFAVSYDANGNALWAQSGGGNFIDRGEAIAVDASGNTYVTGFYNDTASFGSFTFTSAGAADIVIAKYAAPPPTAAPQRPVAFSLRPAVPNPFNPATTLSFALPAAARVELAVFDLSGRLVRLLIDQEMSAGEHSLVWHGRDDAGRRVASGAYVYRLRAGARVETRTMVLLK